MRFRRGLVGLGFGLLISSPYGHAQQSPSSLDDLQKQIDDAKAKAAHAAARHPAHHSATKHVSPQSPPPDNLAPPTDPNRLRFDDGSTYEGGIRNGAPDGRGVITATNGEHLTGTFSPDHESGTWDNGNRYDGGFRNGYRNGQGSMTYADGSRYEGNWVNGGRIGFGVLTWPDGGRYQGVWIQDHPNGQGTFFKSDGQVFSGNWVDGCFTDPNDGTRWAAVAVDAAHCGH